MYRLFVALRPPLTIRDLLSATMQGVPGARWQDDDQLHVTLRFIGEVEARQAEDIAIALAGVGARSSTIAVAGVGHFASRGLAHSLWAGLAPAEGLVALHQRIDRALLAAGVAPDGRAYVPHITLARMARSAGGHPAVARWLAVNANLSSEPFTLDQLILYESTLGQAGARYSARAAWPLRSA